MIKKHDKNIETDFINGREEFLNQVRRLGDSNSGTLGFLPYEVYSESLKKNSIIISTISNEVIGYILFRRVKRNRSIAIVQVCIDEYQRNKGCASELIDFLLKEHKSYHYITLKCRIDYKEANKLWERKGFKLQKRVSGRKKSGSKLGVWYYDYQKANLFSSLNNFDINKIPLVFDSSCFIKMFNSYEKDWLFGDWISNELDYFVTPELMNELNRNQDFEVFDQQMKFLKHNFKVLENTLDVNLFNEIRKQIASNKDIGSDIRHICYTIQSNIKYFLTYDQDDLLSNHDFFKNEYDIEVLKPEHFISILDTIDNPEKYRPLDIKGSDIFQISSSYNDYKTIIDSFYKHNTREKKKDFSTIINEAFSNPKNYQILIFKKSDTPLALIVLNEIKNSVSIPIFRISKSKISNTIIQHLIYYLLHKYKTKNMQSLTISDKYLDIEFEAILKEMYFIKNNDIWYKVFDYGLLTSKEFIKRINTSEEQIDNDIKYLIERYFWPIKIKDLKIKNYIIPIQANWAGTLFADEISQQNIFKEDFYKLLNRENVYYRSGDKRIKSPSRVVWYISKDKNLDSKYIGYSSYIDDVYIDYPKRLYKKFEPLGVYKWEQVFKTAHNDINKKICAFKFTDTEKFNTKVGLRSIQRIYQKYHQKSLNLVSPVEINENCFLELYSEGMYE